MLHIACCRLHGLLLDQDATLAIFGYFISTQPITLDAFNAEAKGELCDAVALYTEVLC
jgi:hypothetical protein